MLQTYGHADPLCQVPVASHVWGVAPEHRVEPGTHEPEQLPEVHT
jgi:hypothetical protein